MITVNGKDYNITNKLMELYPTIEELTEYFELLEQEGE